MTDLSDFEHLDRPEAFLAVKVAGEFEGIAERPPLAAGLIGAHRWGIDLERGPGEQRYAHRSEAIEDAMHDLAAEGYLSVVGDAVVEAAQELLEQIDEDADGIDLNGRGGIVESVDDGAAEGSA